MGSNGSKEGEQLSQLEINYYMGVQTTPESRLQPKSADSITGIVESSKSIPTTSSVGPTSSFVPRQVQLRSSTTSASTRPTTTTSTVASTISASATTASTRPTVTTTSIRPATPIPSSTASNLTAKSAVAAAKWRPVGCAPATDDEEEEEDRIDRGTQRKMLTARRAKAIQPPAPSINPIQLPPSNPLSLAQTSYDDPYGYIAEAVRRTAEEVNKRKETAVGRPAPSPRTMATTAPEPAAAAPSQPVAPTQTSPAARNTASAAAAASQPEAHAATGAPFDPVLTLAHLAMVGQRLYGTPDPTAPSTPAARKKMLAIIDPYNPALRTQTESSSSDLEDGDYRARKKVSECQESSSARLSKGSSNNATSTKLPMQYETAKKLYPFQMSGVSKEDYERQWRDTKTIPVPLFGNSSSKPASVTAPVTNQPPWRDDSDDESEELPSRPGTRHVAGSRQITRPGEAKQEPSRPSLPTPSTSTGYKWPSDIDEALSRLSLADATSGTSSQRKAPIPARRTIFTASAAASTTKVPVAAAIESVKSAGDWKALLKSHEQFKDTYRRAMSDSRTTVTAPAAAAPPPSACPPYRFSNDAEEDDQSASSSNWKPVTAAPKAAAVVSASDVTRECRFDYDDLHAVPRPEALKAPTTVVSASSAAREFAAAAASPRPVFQASSSDSSEEEDEEDEDDFGPVAPYASVGGGRTELMERFNKAMSVNPTLVKKLESMRSLSNLSHASLCEADTPVYTLSVGHKHICVFEPGREKIIRSRREELEMPDIDEEQIYRTTYITKDGLGDFFLPTDRYRDQLTERPSFIYSTPELYRQLIIPALLLGSRVRDFEQRCATVVQLGDMVLNMPAQNNKRMKGKPLKLRTISGILFEVRVKNVIACDADKRWVVECETPDQPLPRKVRMGALLEILGSYDAQPRVTGALMSYYAGSRFKFHIKSGKQKKDRPSDIGHWDLLECIYGPPSDRYFPPVNSANPMIHLAKNGGVVQLNPQQAEAVARYNCPVSPAFVVESPPGSGKTMTAAAMAVSYKGDGVQLFLSTANVPVINMALALAKLDYGLLKAIHFISSEREDLMTEETRSPFSVLSLAKANEAMNEQITALEQQLAYAPNDEEKDKIKAAIVKACGPVFADTYDIYFATVDMILGRLFKKNHNGKHQPDTIKKQLINSVRRIVVDEASQLTEAALNALILSFPEAQIVLIGDSKQLPPFRYSPRDVVSKLAARPALEVIKDKMNLPVITLSRVYRASPSMMAHYSECFYEGRLESFKPESVKSLLSCFGSRSKGSKCLFWKVDKGVAKKWGTSKFNYAEITSLCYIVNILKNSGYSEKEVMIISYYEAQRKKAEEELKELGDYELLTVDSAQGREKKIVIVLTTRTSVPVQNDSVQAGEFFTCALRCNVAVSRHQEALIVLGHPSIAMAPNWARVLSPKYFRHVEDTRSWKGGWVRSN